MQQVTRRVVCDAKRERCAWLRAGGSQKLADVANTLGYVARTGGPLGVVGEQVPVLFHHRATAGGIHANELGAAGSECGDVRPRECACRLEVARVCVQRTATDLTRGVGHSIAVRLQRPACRAIRASEEPVHHAAIEERDARAAFVSRGVVVAFREGHARRRKHRRRESQTAGDGGEQRRNARCPQHSGCEHGDTECANVGEDGEHDAPDERRRPHLAKSRARGLEQLTVRYTRWTCGLTGAASETAIDVRVHARIVGAQLAFHERPHEDDAPARAVVLVLEVHVRWTGLQAEAAVDARLDAR